MKDLLKIQLLTNTAKAPEKANEGDLWDLFADTFENGEDAFVLKPHQRTLVKTGIAIELPKLINNETNITRYANAKIYSRSGLALKNGVAVLNAPGIIDNSYRKEIGVILHNFSDKNEYTITKGDKVAQMEVSWLENFITTIVNNIESTNRGGFGSTGR